ncbi:hypothetical protein L484_026222 [Morus notabilis]|uniref:Uncharacterized protein n=1 Tax=Morus notabilis TaxID=981085 RepID=W9RGW5_9ROSA|nr:hypothetical protein L484_026222 [Morus notabilis]
MGSMGEPPVASNHQENQSQPLGRPWSTGLFDCHENQTNAVMTAFFPCVTFGQIAEVLDGGEMGNFPSLHVDGLVDKKEFRELKIRGLDPALGWNGILAQQQARQYQGETQDVPPPAQAMSM